MTAKFEFLPAHVIAAKSSAAWDSLNLDRGALQKQWTVGASSCSVFRMWKYFALLVFLAMPLSAQDGQGTAYEALRVVGGQNREYLNHVISVVGVDGTPEPATWRILVEDPGAPSGVREFEVSEGRIRADRPSRTVAGSTQGATLKTSRLNLDSSGAYAVASHTAEHSHAQFSTASYTLRTDERGDPVWIVTLQTRSKRPVGTIYIGAKSGNVTRTEGMFSGATMDDVATEENVETGSEERGSGVISTTKARIRDSFRHAQDGARETFNHWRRSFADFISPD